MTGARELFEWMVVARTLGTTLCTLNVRWFPAEGEEAVHVGSFVDLRSTMRQHRIIGIRSWST